VTDDLSTRLLEAITKAERAEVDALLETKTSWSLTDDGEGHEVHCECGWLLAGDGDELLVLARRHVAQHGEPGSPLRLCKAHREIVEHWQANQNGLEAVEGTILAAACKVRLGAYDNVLKALAHGYGIETP